MLANLRMGSLGLGRLAEVARQYRKDRFSSSEVDFLMGLTMAGIERPLLGVDPPNSMGVLGRESRQQICDEDPGCLGSFDVRSSMCAHQVSGWVSGNLRV